MHSVKYMHQEAFAGYKISRSPGWDTLKLSQPQKIIDAVCTHVPELLSETAPGDLYKGTELHPLAAGQKVSTKGKLA